MINRFIVLGGMCILVFTNLANASEVKEGDNVPPLVIETKDLKYAGITVNWDKNPTIMARREVNIHQKPSPTSPVVGSIGKFEKVSILDAKAYIYPRMGATKIVDNIPKSSILPKDEKYIPKVGDTVYIVYYQRSIPAIAWYKNHFITLPTYSNSLDNDINIKMPLKYDSYLSDKFYAIYEGYTNIKDVTPDFKVRIECPGDRDRDGDNIQVGMSNCELFYGEAYRRNADVWLYVKNKTGNEGWIQLINAHLGAQEDKQIWWRQVRVTDIDKFDVRLWREQIFCDEIKSK